MLREVKFGLFKGKSQIMEPRLPSSRQWTELPAELLKQMNSVFQEGFRSQLGNATVEIEGRIYPNELLISMGFSRPNQLKQPNFQVSATYDPKKDNVLNLVHLCFDAIGALFDQYFQSPDDTEFPLYWEESEFEGRRIHIQYSGKNTKLEEEADKLLGIDKEGLMQEDSTDTEEHLKAIKSKLGLTEEE